MAYVQGLLSRPSLNMVQDWALRYHLEMERRIFIEDKEAELDRHLLNINPEAWKKVEEERELQRQLEEYPVNDPRQLDRWVANLNKTKKMSGIDVPQEPFWSLTADE